MTDSDFELRLIAALQPIRGFALAQGTYHLFASGIFDQIADAPSGLDDLAKTLDLDTGRVAGFLRFLANEGLVLLRDDVVTLTSRGRDLGQFRPWYELMVGGYAQTFQQITDTLRGGAFATRDGRMVGIGSCGISRFDALPLVRQLVNDLPGRPSRIVDLGCGDGQFLAQLVADYPDVPATGVDPYAPSAVAGADGIDLTFQRATATAYLRIFEPEHSEERGGVLFLAAFLLQEVLEQEGRSAVVEMVRQVLRHGGHLAVVEVDHRPADASVMRHGLGLAYYNPYYLLHVLTEQRLETAQFWQELFSEAGAEVVVRRTVDAGVDSTGLEFGCLLRAVS